MFKKETHACWLDTVSKYPAKCIGHSMNITCIGGSALYGNENLVLNDGHACETVVELGQVSLPQRKGPNKSYF